MASAFDKAIVELVAAVSREGDDDGTWDEAGHARFAANWTRDHPNSVAAVRAACAEELMGPPCRECPMQRTCVNDSVCGDTIAPGSDACHFLRINRCPGIDLGNGKFSGCAWGDGTATAETPEDCPVCDGTGHPLVQPSPVKP